MPAPARWIHRRIERRFLRSLQARIAKLETQIGVSYVGDLDSEDASHYQAAYLAICDANIHIKRVKLARRKRASQGD